MTHPQDVEPAGLKPCPFCGGEAEIVHIEDGENAGGSCVSCKRCMASSNVEFEFKENFVSNWNTRASPSPSGDVREAVARIVDPDAFARLDALVAERTASKHALLIREISPIIGPALSKADQIAALYVERIGVGGSSQDPSHTHNAATPKSAATEGEGA